MSNFIAQVLSTVPASHSVTYSCQFTNNWTSESHPVNYPENDAHWSAPVVVAHSNEYTMWEPGELASNGVRIVAETGDPDKLQREVAYRTRMNIEAGDVITGEDQSNSNTQEQTLPDIVMTPWFNMLSSITMIAPSPDWYSGFYNVNPVDPSSMVWYESFEIATYPWDAGTDEGDNFDSSDQAEDPRVPIQQLTEGVLLNPDKAEVLAMATWSCSLKGSSSFADSDIKGKSNKDCKWVGENEKKRKSRCKKKYKGRPMSVWCPKACYMPELSTVPASHSVTYSCKFNNMWSSENHPINYPGNDAHWSAPVLAAHSKKYKMWKPGKLASDGVKIVAETGIPGTLQEEVGEAKNNIKAGDVITGFVQFNNNTQGQTLPDIALTPWFDMMSSITMVAPSPDWYTGFYNVNPVDPKKMVWYKSFEIATYPWDAGTNKGKDFNSNNQAEDPRVPIQQLTEGVLLNPDKAEVLAMATWSCTLNDSSSCVNNDTAMKGPEKLCNWVGDKDEKFIKKTCKKEYLGRPYSVWCPLACKVCTE